MTKNDAENALIRYWQLGAVLLALAVTWGTLKADVDQLKKEQAQEETEIAALIRQDAELKNKLTEIETNQKHIKEDVEEAKEIGKDNADKLDRILEKLAEDE